VEITIRPARPDDGDTLREVELLAGERFREVGLDAIADHEPAPLDTLARYAIGGRSWVAADDADAPVGYVLVDVVDGAAHVEQISVLPDHQGRGIGQRLLDQVQAWAVETGRRAVTLTTFSHVPWNRPLYEHLGFRVLTEAEIGPELQALCEVEAAHGLDPAVRVCMGLDPALAGETAPL
jgi:ribosomal protein S18 acetylase RimI-like enzyme